MVELSRPWVQSLVCTYVCMHIHVVHVCESTHTKHLEVLNCITYIHIKSVARG